MINGSIVALVTPFDDDNNIDYFALDKMLKYQIDNKTDGILLLGTTGESEALNDDEKYNLVKHSLDYVSNKIKIMVGLISNVPDRIIELANIFKDLDIDSFLVSGPYYIKTNDSGLIKYFTYIADRVDKPIILYNVPKRTGLSISFDVVRLLSYHHNIIGIKEASGDMSYQTKISSICNDSFVLYGADDDTMLSSLVLGAKGIISVIGNAFPREVSLIVKSFTKNLDISRVTFFKIHNLIRDMFLETSPIPIKYLMYIKGFSSSKTRMPLGEVSLYLKRKVEEDYLILLE